MYNRPVFLWGLDYFVQHAFEINLCCYVLQYHLPLKKKYLNSIQFYIYSIICLSIHFCLDRWVISILRVL